MKIHRKERNPIFLDSALYFSLLGLAVYEIDLSNLLRVYDLLYVPLFPIVHVVLIILTNGDFGALKLLNH